MPIETRDVLTKSSLSARRARLLEAMQKNPYSRIFDLRIAGGDPVLDDPPPRIVRDIKLGSVDSGDRPELKRADFTLKREHIQLFQTLDQLGDGVIDQLEVKGGLPFRILIQTRI